QDGGYDYQPAGSLRALANGKWLAGDERPTVILGEVVGWSDGRSLVESAENGSGLTWIDHYAVLEVKVAENYGTQDRYIRDSRVYVEVPRGGEQRIDGELDDDGKPSVSSIEELSSAVPKGTRVIA